MQHSSGWDARAIRALVAICAAAGLAFLMFLHERAQSDAKQRAIFEASSTSWKVSEMIFEIQRLQGGLNDYMDGMLPKSDVAVRFDLVWSRISVLRATEVGQVGALDDLLSEILEFLDEEEALLYEMGPVSRQDYTRIRLRLENLARDLRVLWVDFFISRYDQSHLVDLREDQQMTARNQRLMMSLIALLMLYVLVEVYNAGRAQRRERALREIAARANEAKSRFLANVSHEIRTPLNGILGMASELSESPLTQDQAQCLQVLQESGGVLLSTINDVLDLSRVEAGHMEVDMRAVSLRKLVTSAVALYEARAREKQLDLSMDLDTALPEQLVLDSRRLRQVLHNLIANAVKFTETGRVLVTVSKAGETLTIAVQDSGPGIPLAAHERIFEPFGQADSSATRAHGGTGLGLAISRQICEAMGGSLSLQSTEGQGATFTVSLPLIEAPTPVVQASTQTSDQGVPDLNGLHILVVDDNATNRLLLNRFLSATKAQLSFAENGQLALDAAMADHFDAILMDIQMPVMDGMTAAQAIRAFQTGARQPASHIVAVTANVMAHQVEEYRSAGMDDVLSKPVSKRALLDCLRQLEAAQAA